MHLHRIFLAPFKYAHRPNVTSTIYLRDFILSVSQVTMPPITSKILDDKSPAPVPAPALARAPAPVSVPGPPSALLPLPVHAPSPVPTPIIVDTVTDVTGPLPFPCYVCASRTADVLLHPCRHICICTCCAITLGDKNVNAMTQPRCPRCYTAVTTFTTVCDF